MAAVIDQDYPDACVYCHRPVTRREARDQGACDACWAGAFTSPEVDHQLSAPGLAEHLAAVRASRRGG